MVHISGSRHDLHLLQRQLENIQASISKSNLLEPASRDRPPILDACTTLGKGGDEAPDVDHSWLQLRAVPGLRDLRDAVKRDLDVLPKFHADPNSADLPPPSMNAPYLIAVWNEVLHAPRPILSIFKMFSSGGDHTLPPNAKAKSRHKPTGGVKVDIEAANGRRWIRVNTIKNSRMLAEFREIDSYLTGSEDDDSGEGLDDTHGPSLVQTEFDNSVLRMGRSLLNAAKENPVPGSTTDFPQITIRLTRVNPTSGASGGCTDPRIAKTIQCLSDMGLDVQMGERGDATQPDAKMRAACPEYPPPPLLPSMRINLDLSVLIALVSDITHAPLPTSAEDAHQRFVPPKSYVEWKKERASMIETTRVRRKCTGGAVKGGKADGQTAATIDHTQEEFGKHSRQLIDQTLQEMGKGLLEEVRDRLLSLSLTAPAIFPPVEFWTTPEARDRCLRIVSNIGGPNEKRRAHALFPSASDPVEAAGSLYWLGSRYPHAYIPLLPIRIHSSQLPKEHVPVPSESKPLSPFFHSLAQTCKDILAQEVIPHPRALPDDLVQGHHQIQRAIVTKGNSRLTAHTVQSMLWGAELGWTTMTANRSSVKALNREMSERRSDVNVCYEDPSPLSPETAAIWIVDARSLSEGMRGDLEQ